MPAWVKRIIPLLPIAIVLCPLHSIAKIVTFPEYNCSIEIPDKWVEIPLEEHRDHYFEEEDAEGNPVAFYAKMFQLEDTEFWLEAPMIGIRFTYPGMPLADLYEFFENVGKRRGFESTAYIDEDLGAVVHEQIPGENYGDAEADIGYLFPGLETIARVTFLVDPGEALLWKYEFYDISKSFEFNEGWGPAEDQEQSEFVLTGVIKPLKVACGVFLVALGGVWFFGRRYGRCADDDTRAKGWWQWPLVPVASIVAAFVATALFVFSNMWFGGIGEGLWGKYILPIISRGFFGWGWVWAAYLVAPAFKVRASLFMAALLFSLIVGAWVMFFSMGVGWGGWHLVNMILETISLAIGGGVALAAIIEDGD